MSIQVASTHLIPLEASNAALKCAALLARETAIATNTNLIIMQNGKIISIPAKELAAQQQNKQVE